MPFVQTSYENIGQDIMCLNADVILSLAALKEERQFWQDAYQQNSTKGSTAEQFLHATMQVYDIGKMVVQAAQKAESPDPGIAMAAFDVAGRYAFSLFARELFLPDQAAIHEDQIYDEAAANKILLDDAPDSMQEGAYSVIMDTAYLDGPPFISHSPILKSEKQWYKSGKGDLYVSATSPANPSDALVRTLTRSMGSHKRAIKTIDAANSCTLHPYVSKSFMVSRIASHMADQIYKANTKR